MRANARSAALLPGSLLITERVASFYSSTLPALAGRRLADLGCGTAPLRPFYERFVERSWALDWPSSVHSVQINAFADLAGGVPLRTGAVDTILISDVLEHLVDPADLLSECHRLLEPGGRLIGNVPFMYGLHEEPHDHYRYTEHGLRHLLLAAGFTDVRVRPIGGGIDVVVDILAKLTSQVPFVGPRFARALQRSWLAVTSLAPLRTKLREVERRLPLAYGFTGRRDA